MQPGSETKAEIEARARAEGGIAEQLRQHDTRLTANHDSLAMLREWVARQDTAIKVIGTEVKEIRTDVGEIGTRMEIRLDEMHKRLDSIGRNFYVAASTMGGLMLSVLALIVALFVGF